MNSREPHIQVRVTGGDPDRVARAQALIHQALMEGGWSDKPPERPLRLVADGQRQDRKRDRS